MRWLQKGNSKVSKVKKQDAFSSPARKSFARWFPVSLFGDQKCKLSKISFSYLSYSTPTILYPSSPTFASTKDQIRTSIAEIELKKYEIVISSNENDQPKSVEVSRQQYRDERASVDVFSWGF